MRLSSDTRQEDNRIIEDCYAVCLLVFGFLGFWFFIVRRAHPLRAWLRSGLDTGQIGIFTFGTRPGVCFALAPFGPAAFFLFLLFGFGSFSSAFIS